MASSAHEALTLTDLAPWNAKGAATSSTPTSNTQTEVGNVAPSLILMQDTTTCSGDFVLAQFIRDKLNQQDCVCLVAVSKEYEWYQSVLSKMGIQLERHRKAGTFYFIDATLAAHADWITAAKSGEEEKSSTSSRAPPTLATLSVDILKYFRVWHENGITNCGSLNIAVDNLTLIASLFTAESRTHLTDWVRFLRGLVTSSKSSKSNDMLVVSNQKGPAKTGCVLLAYPLDLTPTYDLAPIEAGTGEVSAIKDVAPVGLSALVTPASFTPSQFSMWLVHETLPNAILSVTPLATGYSKDFQGRLAVYVPSELTRLVNIPGITPEHVVRGGARGALTAGPFGSTSSLAHENEPSGDVQDKTTREHGQGGYYKAYHIQVKDNSVMCFPR